MDAGSQRALMELYRSNALKGIDPPSWRDLGFRINSQFDEDGFLIYIFSLIGFKTRKVVEACCGTGDESNTANLIANHSCIGTLFEADPEKADTARRFYASQPLCGIWPPNVICEWITAKNVNRLLEEHGATGEVDLLSIDIDGIDYWLWKAIDAISPRVVVTEINHLWGPDEAVTVPYADDFKAVFTQYGSDYAGASIAAFVKLAQDKGYRLVGGNSIGINAFFVRNDIQHPWLPEVATQTLFWHPRTKFGQDIRLPGVIGMNWQRV